MNTPCSDCGSTDRTYTLQINIFMQSFNGIEKEVHAPQVKETCTKCNRYIRFTPQTKELMDQFNAILKKNPIITESEERLL